MPKPFTASSLASKVREVLDKEKRKQHLNTGIEKRRHPRAPISLPVVLKTTHGLIKGKTANISVGGLAIILLSEKPEIGDEFQIILKRLKTVKYQ